MALTKDGGPFTHSCLREGLGAFQGGLACALGKSVHTEEGNMAIQLPARERIEAICDQYSHEPTPLIMVLSAIQREFGYVPLEVQEIVSRKMGVSVAEIYGVVTFYSFFSLVPKGKYVIGCCLGTACYVKGSQNIIDQFCEILGVQPGGTSEDGLFTVDALRCIGACAAAPAVSINGKVYARVKVTDVPRLIASYRELNDEEVSA